LIGFSTGKKTKREKDEKKKNPYPWRKGHLSIHLTRAMRLICIGFGFITSIGRQVGQQ